MPPVMTAMLSRADGATAYMRPGGARRALLTFLQYDGAPAGSRATTLRLVCFPGCAVSDLRHMLAPFGLALRDDGTGHGVTPAGPVLCAISSLGGPRPVLTVWKTAAVERAVLAGVLKDGNGLLGAFPVAVFKDVLWPWVREAARSGAEKGKLTQDVRCYQNRPHMPSRNENNQDPANANGHHDVDDASSESGVSNNSVEDDQEEDASDDEQDNALVDDVMEEDEADALFDNAQPGP